MEILISIIVFALTQTYLVYKVLEYYVNQRLDKENRKFKLERSKRQLYEYALKHKQ